MKHMKKLFALLLAVAMLLSMAVAAGAEENAATTKASATGAAYITIEGARAGTYYELYRILDVETVPTTGEPIYLVREDTREGATGKYWDDFIRDHTAQFTLSEDGKYLKNTNLVGASDSQLQQFAKDVWNYASANGISPDIAVPITVSGTHVSAAPRPYGYYVMRSFHVNENAERVYSDMANVFTLPYKDPSTGVFGNLTVQEKNEVDHNIVKEVKEDSLEDPADDNVGWVKSNAAEIEQPIKFRITVDLAPGTDVYEIVDNMPNFENISEPVVYHSGGTLLTKGDEYTIPTEENREVPGFTIVLSDSFRKIVTDADSLTILYTAYLKSSATVADGANVNTAILKHGGKEVGTSTTTTYTCQFNVKKVDETGENPLAGATFQVQKADGGVMRFKKDVSKTSVDTYIVDPMGQADIVTNETGMFVICGLDTHDKYYLVETVAPAGYVKMDKVEITIIPDSTSENPSYSKDITVVNLPGVDMPTTGGMGTTLFYAVGGVMVLCAVVLLVTKKRMRG